MLTFESVVQCGVCGVVWCCVCVCVCVWCGVVLLSAHTCVVSSSVNAHDIVNNLHLPAGKHDQFGGMS